MRLNRLSLATTPAPARPSLLMVSHCVPTWRPSRGGDAARRRAWQLLLGVSDTHEVYLACLADGPVSLQQWRDVSKRVKQVSIAPSGVLRRWASKLIATASPARAERFRIGDAMHRPIAEWCGRVQFSTVLHTRAALLPSTDEVAGARRVVDVESLAAVQRGELKGADRIIVASEADAASAAAIGMPALVLPPITGLTLTVRETEPALPALPTTLPKAA